MQSLPSTRREIESYIPHRAPFIFIDRVTELSDNSISVESIVSASDSHFAGHFPTMPILPGVIIIETVAQTGALLVNLSGQLSEGKFMAFSSVDQAKFKTPVYPDCKLQVDVKIVRRRGPFFKFAGRAHLDGETVATVDFTAAQIDFKLES